MRLLHLDWPHLPLRLERMVRPLPELAVLGGHPWDPGRVLDCSPSARRHGVRRGMTLAAAHALVPDAAFLVPDLDRYREAAEAALDALAAFAPYVEGETDPVRDGFGGAYLGIDGLERLWGTESVLLARLAAAVAPHVPGPLRAGIAGSRFGSLVAAILARDPVPGTGMTWLAAPVGGTESEAAFLAPLPVTLLPASPDTQERLRVLGVRRIGEFATLPRAAVMARFGAEGSFLHDLATGCDGRRIVPRRPAERLRAEAELDPPVDSLESIRFVLHRLADALCGQLAARGAGATLARVECHEVVAGRARERGTRPGPGARNGDRGIRPDVLVVEQPLPGPIARADAVERLLLARLEKAPPEHPVERIALELDRVVPAAGRQLGLFAPQAARAARLEWQLADLAIRFGEGRVLRAALHDPEARLPEQRSGWLEATGAGRVP
jgi:protein ImuB